MVSKFSQNGKTILTLFLIMFMVYIQTTQACGNINSPCDISNNPCCAQLVCGDRNICEYPY